MGIIFAWFVDLQGIKRKLEVVVFFNILFFYYKEAISKGYI